MPTSNGSLVNSKPIYSSHYAINHLSNPLPPKVLDFDTDGCYNVPAIDSGGYLNPGMACTSSPQGGCRDEWDLDNNQVYSRSRCNNGWCAHLYAYYFEKDFDKCGLAGGHTHDWEHVVVWTKGDEGKFVGVSAHGEYDVRAWSNVRRDGDTHAKVVYHLGGALGTRTHSFRFANSDDDRIENHKGRWFVSYAVLLKIFLPYLEWDTDLHDPGWYPHQLLWLAIRPAPHQDDEPQLGQG